MVKNVSLFKNVKLYYYFGIILTFIILDFLSKNWIISNFSLGESLSILPNINIYYVKNSGIVFGFFSGEEYCRKYLLIIINILCIFVLFLIINKNWLYISYLSIFPFLMIIGGAIGNLLDRIIYGYVIDFIDIYISIYHFPTFNLADLNICIGIEYIILNNFSFFIRKNIR
ncbi:signal peptidase II [Candidatus Schneideria nysicola]|uniref:signal peptidase II n=1 Tax=Candidatus Schneideria nysicola TaxID=1081631 RepID=UPI001CAA4AB8|nr:signal peptidase II [Candidatus Schneideria nysicola]UAJ65008.1 signal peptidase II [Candidatus Schneideria nysicola]